MRLVILFFTSLVFVSTCKAQPSMPDPTVLITKEIQKEVLGWLSNPIVALSIQTQNELRGKLPESRLLELDKQWRRERGEADKPLISATLSAPLSTYLLRIQAGALGLYSEIFVVDANGLNVGQSAITSDYWQGDEAKFQKTFPLGPSAVFLDEPEWDEGLQIWRSQLNLSVADLKTGKAIGAATVEFNLTELQRRAAAASK